jgi:hypothetical protein
MYHQPPWHPSGEGKVSAWCDVCLIWPVHMPQAQSSLMRLTLSAMHGGKIFLSNSINLPMIHIVMMVLEN